MHLVWTLTEDGAFICGDLDSRVTAYSYPTSQYADQVARAKSAKTVSRLALSLLTNERSNRHGFEHEAQYDANNWRRINFGSDD